MIRAAVLLLAVAGCDPAIHPAHLSARPQPPFAACLQKPKKLPAIATGAQVRARHDQIDRLYDDCATRALRNAQAFRFYVR